VVDAEGPVDPEHMAVLVDSVTACLQSPKLQSASVQAPLLLRVVFVLVRSQLLNQQHKPPLNPQCLRYKSFCDDYLRLLRPEEGEPELKPSRQKLIQSLADISCLEEYRQTFVTELDTYVFLHNCLRASNETLQLASCILIGNGAASHEISAQLIDRWHVEVDLLRLLRESRNVDVQQMALALLKNLALAPQNRSALAEAGTIKVISQFWVQKPNPQIPHAAVAVVRVMVTDSLANIELFAGLTKICANGRIGALPEPDDNTETSSDANVTYLAKMLEFHGQSDEAGVKMEIGRTIVTMLRVIALADEAQQRILVEALLKHDIGEAVESIICQERFPVIRSEAWFILALLSRTDTTLLPPILSRHNIFAELKKVLECIVEAELSASDTSEEQNGASVIQRKKDRQNVVALVGLLGQKNVVLTADGQTQETKTMLQNRKIENGGLAG